jgi:hypothetical protein
MLDVLVGMLQGFLVVVCCLLTVGAFRGGR